MLSRLRRTPQRGRKAANSQLRIERIPEGSYTAWNRQQPVAPRCRTWLRYTEFQNALGGVPTNFDYIFNLNSLFDPNRTGAGHQPRGFDQLAALYGRYRVYRVRYHVIAFLQGAVQDAQVLTTFISNSTASSAAFSDAAEQPYALSAPYNLYQSGSIKGSADLAKVNGKTALAYAADDTTQAVVTASPTETICLHVTGASILGNATSTAIAVIIDYDCEFSDINQLSQS